MNILWIEDKRKRFEKEFFLKTGLFEKQLNKIIKPNSLDESFTEIQKVTQNIDYVVIDINLEEFNIGNYGKELMNQFDLVEHEFLKEAGFHLYINLIQSGFNKDRIIFLTGNTEDNKVTVNYRQFFSAIRNKDEERMNLVLDETNKILKESEYNKIVELINSGDREQLELYWKNILKQYENTGRGLNNTYSDFKKRFREARIPVSFSISKNDVADFHSWLKDINNKNNPDYKYIQLRRAIIDSFTELIEIIEKNKLDDFLIYNKTLYDKFGILLKDNGIQYLTKLKNYFPLNPPENINQFFYSFIRELSDLWEKSQGYLKQSDIETSSKLEFNFKNFCQNQMKLLRNWTAHNQLSNELSEKELAFYFIIAMRALIDMDINNINRYEKILFSIFERENDHTFSENDIKRKLAESYYKLRSIFSKNDNPSRSEFNEVLREVWKQKGFKKQYSIKYFYQNFWHGVYPALLNLYEINKNDEFKKLHDKVIMYVSFDNESKESSYKSYDFLKELGAAIYNLSFD